MDMSTPGSGPNGAEKKPGAQERESRIQENMGAGPLEFPDRSNPALAEVLPFPAKQSPEHDHMPVWMQRTFLVVYVLFCVEIGLVLTALPWTRVWTDNSLIVSLPTLRAVAQHNFVRGMISGIGLLDIWLGVWEAVRYRDHRPVRT